MPTIIPHFAAGCALFIIGRFYFKDYFDGKDKTGERYYLFCVCVICSFIPDFILVFYYTTKIYSYETWSPYHIFAHYILGLVAVILLLALKYRIDVKRKPLWIMGLWAILLHVVMDMFVPESGVWY